MRIQDLHILPRLSDGLSYLYLEHGKIDRSLNAVEFVDKDGRVMIPVSSLAVLMLGPGTSITHEAIKTLADNGCLVNWCGEHGVRFYAQGTGETRKGYQLLRQAELVCDPAKHMEVVRRMYQFRFDEDLSPSLTMEQVRGYEGARVRRAYAEAGKRFRVLWFGRSYDRQKWSASDPINRALSTANACLNGLCHAAIVSAGYSAGLGFVHTGKQLSFVYDVADFYKTSLTVPLAFRLTSDSISDLERRVRHACRNVFYSERLLGRIVDDIDKVLNVTQPLQSRVKIDIDFDSDPAAPGELWSPSLGNGTDGKRDDVDDAGGWEVPGGCNYS
ncbi:MAG: type I-E CRISPR-associated endonuclease Cas1e [Caldilineaceae bacterium]